MAFLEAGGYPDDLQTLIGWESGQMLRRYTKATAAERAVLAHKRVSGCEKSGSDEPAGGGHHNCWPVDRPHTENVVSGCNITRRSRDAEHYILIQAVSGCPLAIGCG